MKFGAVPMADALGAILAHSQVVGGGRLRKGLVLGPRDIEQLDDAGITQVTVARLGQDDLAEDDAAQQIAAGLQGVAGVRVSAGFTGRVNIYATHTGLVGVDRLAVTALNSIAAEITLASVADLHRVQAGAMIATIKIISYGVDKALVEQARAQIAAALWVHPVLARTASLVLSRSDSMKPSVLAKGEASVRARMAQLGVDLIEVETVAHESAEIGAALRRAKGEILLFLGATATSDRHDIGPEALESIGGIVTRFGIPVDPGNLLFLGRYDGRDVVGLPGCVRSKALNGADWVLERLVCGLEISAGDFAAMGVGGLLKEIPSRPQPRLAVPVSARPNVAVLMLAAGASKRMRGRDKLLENVHGVPMLRHAVAAALGSDANTVVVVLPPDNAPRRAALSGLDVDLVTAVDNAEGMAGSMRNGMAALADTCDAVIIALCDMPDITAAHFDALIRAYNPGAGHEICRATDENGVPGQPVLFGRRFFENLALVSGDKGGRDVVREAPEFVVDVTIGGMAARIDLDTPEDWDRWRKSHQP